LGINIDVAPYPFVLIRASRGSSFSLLTSLFVFNFMFASRFVVQCSSFHPWSERTSPQIAGEPEPEHEPRTEKSEV
jgi:hypothetical protein